MYRTSKLFHGCATVSVLYPLIIYVASTSLLLVVEGAHAPPSQSDVEEAEKVIGNLLRLKESTSWLSGLSKTRSAPLTIEDLMNEILSVTSPEEEIWKAASIVSESLKEQALKGIKTESVLGQAENWKHLIEHIENEDDIICLYRKNSGETAKKADDWKKFLRTVTPGYTVHLAIDTGRKYVICLKKIEVQETTPEEITTTEAALSAAVTSVQSPAAVTMVRPMTAVKLNIPVSAIRKNNNKLDDKHRRSGRKCSCKSLEDTENKEDDDFGNNKYIDAKYDARDGYALYEKEYNSRLQRGMENELRNNGKPLVTSFRRVSCRNKPGSAKNPECNRPVVLVMQNGYNPQRYRPGTSLEILTQRNRGTDRRPPPSTYPMFLSKHLQTLKFSPKIPPSHPVTLNSPQFIRSNKYACLDYKIPCKKMHKVVTKSTSNLNVKPNQQPIASTIDMLLLHNARNAFVPQTLNVKKTRGSQFVNQNINFNTNVRYPAGNYGLRKIEGQSDSNFPNSLTRRPLGNFHLDISTRSKVTLPRQTSPNEANPVNENIMSLLTQDGNTYLSRQVLETSNSSLSSSPELIAQKPAQQTSQSFAPLINIENTAQSSSIDREMLSRPSPPLMQNFNQNSIQLVNPLDRHSPVQNLPQNSMTNNLVRPNVLIPPQIKSPFFVGPIPLNSMYNMGINNPGDRTALTNPLPRYRNIPPCPLGRYHLPRNLVPCPSPCDRPVKLQIMVNGKVQEPLKISVISEPGQRVEIVGSDKPVMPVGSRSLSEGIPLIDHFEDEEGNIEMEDLEMNEPENELKEDTHEDLNDEEEEEKVNPELEIMDDEKEDEMNETVSSVVTESYGSKNLNDERNTTMELNAQTTIMDGPEIETTEGQEIKQKFLNEVTKEISSRASATEIDTTTFAITNSTVDE